MQPIDSKSTNDGHFGKIDDPDLTWEVTNKAWPTLPKSCLTLRLVRHRFIPQNGGTFLSSASP